jgi:hypothetical protein
VLPEQRRRVLKRARLVVGEWRRPRRFLRSLFSCRLLWRGMPGEAMHSTCHSGTSRPEMAR